MRHPMQPLHEDEKGVLRFKENKIICWLWESGKIDLNQVACMDFDDDDRIQFAQLLGYSLCGLGELSYVDDYTYDVARTMYAESKTEVEARIEHLESELKYLKEALREPISRLFEIAEEDLR